MPESASEVQRGAVPRSAHRGARERARLEQALRRRPACGRRRQLVRARRRRLPRDDLAQQRGQRLRVHARRARRRQAVLAEQRAERVSARVALALAPAAARRARRVGRAARLAQPAGCAAPAAARALSTQQACSFGAPLTHCVCRQTARLSHGTCARALHGAADCRRPFRNPRTETLARSPGRARRGRAARAGARRR